jgi:hypothetical protein
MTNLGKRDRSSSIFYLPKALEGSVGEKYERNSVLNQNKFLYNNLWQQDSLKIVVEQAGRPLEFMIYL